MPEDRLPAAVQARFMKLTQQLAKSNTLSQRFGVQLSETDIRSLITAEAQSLQATGRLEMGEGILPRLIYAFCDSPYINRDSYYATLETLQDLFYTFKNDLYDALSDDELIEAMHKLFHGKAQGSLEYLENMDTADLVCVLRSDDTDEEEDDD